MKSYLKIMLALLMLTTIIFLIVNFPIRETSNVKLNEDNLIYYYRTGGIAGFNEKTILYTNGTIEKITDRSVTIDKLNESEIQIIKNTIENKDYIVLKTSLLKKLTESTCCDLMYEGYLIKSKCKTITVTFDGKEVNEILYKISKFHFR